MTRRGASTALPSFDDLNLQSIIITAAIALGVWAYCQFQSISNLFGMTRHVTHYLGFIHFAVGYHFFFTSAMVREQPAADARSMWLKIAACLALSATVYLSPRLEPAVYTLFYMHAAENSVYHVYKLSQAPGREPIGPSALFPLLLVLMLGRLSPSYTTAMNLPERFFCLALVFGSIVFLRALLPETSWSGGRKLLAQHGLLIAGFLAVSFFFPEGSVIYDYFIIWHYVIWFVYTWAAKPSTRAKLVWSHVGFAVLYKALYLAADFGIRLGHPAVLFLLISPAAFMAQTACHILVTLVFRKYPRPAPARAGAVRLAPAV